MQQTFQLSQVLGRVLRTLSGCLRQHKAAWATSCCGAKHSPVAGRLSKKEGPTASGNLRSSSRCLRSFSGSAAKAALGEIRYRQELSENVFICEKSFLVWRPRAENWKVTRAKWQKTCRTSISPRSSKSDPDRSATSWGVRNSNSKLNLRPGGSEMTFFWNS